MLQNQAQHRGGLGKVQVVPQSGLQSETGRDSPAGSVEERSRAAYCTKTAVVRAGTLTVPFWPLKVDVRTVGSLEEI